MKCEDSLFPRRVGKDLSWWVTGRAGPTGPCLRAHWAPSSSIPSSLEERKRLLLVKEYPTKNRSNRMDSRIFIYLRNFIRKDHFPLFVLPSLSLHSELFLSEPAHYPMILSSTHFLLGRLEADNQSSFFQIEGR